MQITAIFGGVVSPILPIAVLASVLLMFINGWTDAPVTIATAVSSGALSVKKACLISAVFNILGAVFMSVFGSSVAVSVYSISNISGIENSKGAAVITAAMLAVSVFAIFAFIFSVPTSESHALFAALSGASAAVIGFKAFLNIEWLKVFSGIIVSTLPVIVFSDVAARVLCRKIRDKNKKVFKRLQTASVMALSFSHGAQDGQKFAGVFTVCYALSLGKNAEKAEVPIVAVLLSAALISLGMFCCGKRIISSFSLVAPNNAVAGFAADAVSAFTMVICSLFGIPISTTHTKTASTIGAGTRTHRSVKTFKKFLFFWVITFPFCAITGYIFSKALLLFC